MSICWYCYWGWAKPVAELYDRAEAELGEDLVCYGPAHIVFSDENFADGNIDFCIRECGDHRAQFYDRFDRKDIARLREYLVELRQIPESVRCCCPDEYDGDHPEQFPPNVDVVRR